MTILLMCFPFGYTKYALLPGKILDLYKIAPYNSKLYDVVFELNFLKVNKFTEFIL
jgi:hypothetical protein